ncbi:hypothetical protein [Streptomyces sp. NRRL S-337]|uniref:hypothetical protein n=1 Tax=Streptomyces sp. NRRL S-337 TaxID=1463900 RepID=UPI0004C652D7|nr:hypothetical protein [Streptomyces sp. NRRL S-337]
MKIRLCSISSCRAPRLARGWCEAHYRRWRRHGHPLGGRRHRTGCRVTGCPNPHGAKGLCAMHYERWKRHGDPQFVTVAEVDDVVVERTVLGDRPGRLTVAEREAVVRRLHRAGLRDGQIAERLDIGTSGVWTIRQRLNLPANTAPVGDFSGRCAA